MQLSTTSSMIHCPYCGEQFEIVIDPSETDQAYIEDCYVCCRPIELTVLIDADGDAVVSARSENE